ncbi:Maf family protein [Acetobacter sp. TBRC 12305]|uniref:Nucleoside triphosphate pyrophosphatase n=1 Tax=Acetobacter garciniae TaxID=2817435 RepID=A0A939HLV5_9PROT|nr:Maf family protein [Acetobacter garciniae]MBO1324411.1 Maf family protein [Acetobacter garciniae]MBX0344100.1 Maf family protein [Acetobacter garciniae]
MPALVPPPALLQNNESPLLLASGSHSRRRMLENAGLVFESLTPGVDEDSIKHQARKAGCNAATTALKLAEAKALAVAGGDAVVIGADQMLSCQDRWYDKPTSLEDARAQLRTLRGQTHCLHTAVVLARHGQVVWRHVEEPRLSMRAFSDTFLTRYLQAEGARCLSSVGAYRLEGPGLLLFWHIEGDSFTIQGLPMLALMAALRQMNVLLD